MANLVDLGKVALTLGGVWNSAASYERLTFVLYDVDGCGYIALVSNAGKTPGTDASIWQKASLSGKSIYQLCVDAGTFVGTEAEFIAQYNAAVAAAETASQQTNATNTRVTAAEEQRAAAEIARQQAETQRIASENERSLNESARQTAEVNRVDEFARTKAACEAATESATSAAVYANAKGQKADEKADEANAAATLANQKAALADAAATRADNLSDHPLRINTTTYHWERWDEDTQQYVDTGIMASCSPYATFEVDQENGQLVMTTDEYYGGPTFSLNQTTGELAISI